MHFFFPSIWEKGKWLHCLLEEISAHEQLEGVINSLVIKFYFKTITSLCPSVQSNSVIDSLQCQLAHRVARLTLMNPLFLCLLDCRQILYHRATRESPKLVSSILNLINIRTFPILKPNYGSVKVVLNFNIEIQ